MEIQAENMTKFMNNENYLKDNEIPNFRKHNDDDREMTIFFLDFLFPYVLDVISGIIYNDSLTMTQSFFSDLAPQIQGGIIEYYLLEHIKNKRRFFDTKIYSFESTEIFVPNSFFIQNYSSYRENTKYKYNELKDKTENKEEQIKIKLLEKNILIKQNQFIGKYYDFAILIYSPSKKGFYLVMFQVSKKKVSSQRLYKEEHEIVLSRVKENLEEEFDINIIEGDFCYIFTNLSNDKTTLEFCEEYNIPYLQFSFQTMEFNEEFPFNLEKCFITNNFPFHNYFSILSKENFKFANGFKNNNYKDIIKYKNNFIFKYMSNNQQEILSNFF